jgi:hypothetical protein
MKTEYLIDEIAGLLQVSINENDECYGRRGWNLDLPRLEALCGRFVARKAAEKVGFFHRLGQTYWVTVSRGDKPFRYLPLPLDEILDAVEANGGYEARAA